MSLLLPLVLLVVTACDREWVSRACPIFDHPEAAEWIDYEVGDTIPMMGSNGSSTYTVTNIEYRGVDSTGAYSSSEEELVCGIELRYSLEASDTLGILFLDFIQYEMLTVDSADEYLVILPGISFEDRPPISVALLSITPLDSNGEAPFEEASYHPELRLEGQTFTEVASTTASPDSFGRYMAGDTAILSIAFARGRGLVAIERTDVGMLVLTE